MENQWCSPKGIEVAAEERLVIYPELQNMVSVQCDSLSSAAVYFNRAPCPSLVLKRRPAEDSLLRFPVYVRKSNNNGLVG